MQILKLSISMNMLILQPNFQNDESVTGVLGQDKWDKIEARSLAFKLLVTRELQARYLNTVLSIGQAS